MDIVSVRIGTRDLENSITYFKGLVEVVEDLGVSRYVAEHVVGSLIEADSIQSQGTDLFNERVMTIKSYGDTIYFAEPYGNFLSIQEGIRWANIQGYERYECSYSEESLGISAKTAGVGDRVQLLDIDVRELGTSGAFGFKGVRQPKYEPLHDLSKLKKGEHALVLQRTPIVPVHDCADVKSEAEAQAYVILTELNLEEIIEKLWLRELELCEFVSYHDIRLLNPKSPCEYILTQHWDRSDKHVLSNFHHGGEEFESGTKLPKGTVVFARKNGLERCMNCHGRKFTQEVFASGSVKRNECEKCGATGKVLSKSAEKRMGKEQKFEVDLIPVDRNNRKGISLGGQVVGNKVMVLGSHERLAPGYGQEARFPRNVKPNGLMYPLKGSMVQLARKILSGSGVNGIEVKFTPEPASRSVVRYTLRNFRMLGTKL